MDVKKTPVALIQVLDSEGKVTNFEVEYSPVYVGGNPDIARSFQTTHFREEVTAEVFAAFEAASGTEQAVEIKRNAEQIADLTAKLEEQITARQEETDAHEKAIAARDETIKNLRGFVAKIQLQLVEICKLFV